MGTLRRSLLPQQGRGYGFPPVPRVDLATIAVASHRQQAARILRDEMCNRSDDGNPSAGTVGAD